MEKFNQENIELIQVIDLPTQISDNTKFYLFKRFNEYIHVLIKGNVFEKENVIVRVHSECFFGDVLGSRRCDCGKQLQKAMEIIANEEYGILIYLNQEGRGIGLKNKLEAYKLQMEKDMDTVEANNELGFASDLRDYDACAVILKDYFGLKSIRLLSNNPKKMKGLEEKGLRVKAVPIIIESNKHNKKYLSTKKEKMGHLL